MNWGTIDVRLCLGITDRRRCRPSGDDSACCGELGRIPWPNASGRHMACLPGLRLDTIHPERARACGTRLAVGRRPNTDDLGLDRVGIETDTRGYIAVESAMRIKEVRRAQAAEPEISHTYEILCDDGRKGTVQAIDLATAKKLVVGRYPCIAVFHASLMHVIFAQKRGFRSTH